MATVAEFRKAVTTAAPQIEIAIQKESSAISHLFKDEQGKPSSARWGFWFALTISLLVVMLDALGVGPGLSQPGYTLLGSIDVALVAWAAGPRAFQYFAPQIGNVAAALSKTKRDARWPNRFKDDEKAEEPA